jgi:uncharacterized protein YecE (DUF72 family)
MPLSLSQSCLHPPFRRLPLTLAALLLLEPDAEPPHIPTEHLLSTIDHSIHSGERLAQHPAIPTTSERLINHLLQQQIRISIQDASPTPFIHSASHHKPAQIILYRSSLRRLEAFFQQIDQPIRQGEFLSLLLYPEWARLALHGKKGHGKRKNPFSKELPTYRIHRRGPFPSAQAILAAQQILIHAFVEKVMRLSWSPLALYFFLSSQQKGDSPQQMEETIQQLTQRKAALLSRESPPPPPQK